MWVRERKTWIGGWMVRERKTRMGGWFVGLLVCWTERGTDTEKEYITLHHAQVDT